MFQTLPKEVQEHMDEKKMQETVYTLWDQVKAVIRTAEGEVNGLDLAGFCAEIYVAGFAEGVQAGTLYGGTGEWTVEQGALRVVAGREPAGDRVGEGT